MIQQRESELIAQDLRNQAKQRQAKTPRQNKAQPAPKSAHFRLDDRLDDRIEDQIEGRSAANASYDK